MTPIGRSVRRCPCQRVAGQFQALARLGSSTRHGRGHRWDLDWDPATTRFRSRLGRRWNHRFAWGRPQDLLILRYQAGSTRVGLPIHRSSRRYRCPGRSRPYRTESPRVCRTIRPRPSRWLLRWERYRHGCLLQRRSRNHRFLHWFGRTRKHPRKATQK